MKKRLLLLGGGHAHVHVLRSLIDASMQDVDVTLVSPFSRQVYSGMLPGWVAGHYTLDQCVIPLAPLCKRANVTLIEAAATQIDDTNRTVRCSNGSMHPYDVLSIDTGPVADLETLPGAMEFGLPVRPIESFITAYAALQSTIKTRGADAAPSRLVFVGAGAAGIELALAMAFIFPKTALQLTLISAANTLPGRVGPRLEKHLARAGVRVIAGVGATRITQSAVHLQNGEIEHADHIIVATGTRAAPWLQGAGFACDARGFLLVNEHLQSDSHPHVFAAGDCASMKNQPRPKSGVYAVKAGPPLANNLRRALQGEPLAPYTPQEKSLYLISTGNRYAIGSWGDFAWEGAWVWRWKDRIDRGFMGKYSLPEI